MANLYTNYLKQAYIPKQISTIVENSFWFSQPYFEIVGPESCPAGPAINGVIDYAASSSAERYVQGAPMPAPGVLSDVRFYHTKDFYQETIKIHGDTMAMLANGSNVPLSPVEKAISRGLQNLVNVCQSAFLADLAAQVDSTTAYSDASLSRSTYSIASYEAGSVGTLAKTDLIDMVEALQSSHGFVDTSDMVWVMAPIQVTNIGAFGAVAYHEFSVAGDSSAPIDLGTRFRTKTFEGIDIAEVPGMTNSEIYLLRKSQTKIYLHKEFSVEPKDSAEWASLWLATVGANLVVEDPRRCCKIDGITP
jgi:hypothetical protein